MRSQLSISSQAGIEERRTFTRGRYRRVDLERALAVDLCLDIETEWDDWSKQGLRWYSKAFRLFAPPPELTIPEWADLYRQITTEFAAEPGQWHTEKFEAMREVMEACSPHSKYRRVVLVKPTQSGGTESCILNTIGYTIDVNPRSMLIVFPTIDSAESFSKERLEPMIQAMPNLAGKVEEISSGKNTRGQVHSTVKKKKYPGGFANFVGANSTIGISSRPVPIVMVDEVDLCIQNASRKGNPVKLALARTTTFFDRKEILLSSPSNDPDEAGIITFWGDGTRGRLEKECPNVNCRHYQVLDFDRMDLETATLACESCGNHYPQHKWQDSFFRWQHEFPEHATTISFWMSGLDSPWLDWKVDIVDDYKHCQAVLDKTGDDSLMKVFVNTKLAKEYRKKGKAIEVDLYHERREVYDCHSKGAELPDGVLLVTVGVDVHDTFVTYDATGWGRGRESWGIEAGEFQGDPRIPDSPVWRQLDEFVYRRLWRYADGSYLRTRLMFVDSGHVMDDVYRYCKGRHPRVFAIKGVGGQGLPIIIGGTRQRRQKVVEGVWLIRLGVDTLKDEFHSRLSITSPGPGYCHWPKLANGMPCCGYTPEYFEEIVSEQRELTYNRSGFEQYQWTKNRTDPNEALDCRNYARAALEYLKIKLEQIERDITELNETDIDKVEVGMDRSIYVMKGKPIRQKPKHYGTGRRSIDLPYIDTSGGEEGFRGSGRTTATRTGSRSKYGAGMQSSF
ncbi:MAG TPA: terminase gpA endonuclease subunit [Bacteroidia bacterium]|jgi:phage terminase large subunit GpA-like protein|nr:terminase gpA endonuclease subunit [Bacteroidia bacterium]